MQKNPPSYTFYGSSMNHINHIQNFDQLYNGRVWWIGISSGVYNHPHAQSTGEFLIPFYG